ncbi:MAG: thiolase family protein [Phycisphaerales bacterium]|nr:thiolase family protein [Phycisphaerales bacterium]NNM26293.1 thiolase family protein [Phycisphaerales bacterium]
MSQPVIIAARRTPVGRFLGGLSRIPSPQLGGYAIEAVLEDVPNARDHVDEAIFGCVLQAGLGQNPARQAGLKAGLPETLNAMTVNKVCGSGLQAVMLAAQSIRAGDNELVVAGGFESMSLAPHLAHVRAGVKFGNATLIDHMVHDGLTCPFEGWAMGCAADYIAGSYGVSREEQDRFAARSHQHAAAATEKCHFGPELIPLTGDRLKQKFDVAKDEGIRADSTPEGLARLRPAFDKDGTVTAGNASQLSDGAAALIVASEAKARELGVEPMARIVDAYTAGVAPKEIFHAPAVGIQTILERNKLTIDDLDLVELNEAFAAQTLSNVKVVGIPEEKLNVCGGAIALGHPIGASGARVCTTLVHQLARTGGRRGLASLCLGGGNSVNMLIERG